MRKALLILVFAFSSCLSFGQKIRFTDSTNVWTVIRTEYDLGIHYYPDLYYYAGDTTFNFHTYKKLFGGVAFFTDSHCDPSLIREDTMLNKVFILINDSEQVFMDYNLHLGDTAFHTGFSHDTTRVFVNNIDSTLINGLWYKVWDFQPVGTCHAYYFVIEGIGCLNSPLFINHPSYGLSNFNLMCFSNHGLNPLLSPMVGGYFDNSMSCATILNLNQVNSKNKVTIFPNPINETSKILFPYNISSGNLIIINSIGQTVLNMPIQNKDELLISDKIKEPGIYFFRVTDNETGKVFSGKFVY